MIYVFIDTNIWIRVWSQGKPGCEPTHLERLQQLVNESRITLLVPEIIRLEIEKKFRDFKDKVQEKFDKIERAAVNEAKKESWAEIADLENALVSFFQQAKDQKIANATKYHTDIQAFLSLPKVVNIPFTPDISFRGQRRLIAGRMPQAFSAAHSDACIIESLLEYFSIHSGIEQPLLGEHRLFFCSENTKDFARVEKEGFLLHPLVAEGLPLQSNYFITLQAMMNVYKELNIAPTTPPPKRVFANDQMEVFFLTFIANTLVDYAGDRNELFARLQALSLQEKNSLWAEVEQLLKTLMYREREIVELRLGFGDGFTYTYKEIGRIFKVSATTISRVYIRAMRKLQHPVRQKFLREGLKKVGIG